MNRTQRGMSLIELMVAILISSILILGVTELFSSSYFSSRSNSQLANMQESGRIALEIIGADARRAGFQGCVAADQTYDLGNGHMLPDDAITSTAANNVTFRGAAAGTGCQGAGGAYIPLDMSAPDTVYTSANNTISRNGDPILDNASMAVAFIPTGDPTTSNAIRITITVSDSRTGNAQALNTRSFSGTYELRNRLL